MQSCLNPPISAELADDLVWMGCPGSPQTDYVGKRIGYVVHTVLFSRPWQSLHDGSCNFATSLVGEHWCTEIVPIVLKNYNSQHVLTTATAGKKKLETTAVHKPQAPCISGLQNTAQLYAAYCEEDIVFPTIQHMAFPGNCMWPDFVWRAASTKLIALCLVQGPRRRSMTQDSL